MTPRLTIQVRSMRYPSNGQSGNLIQDLNMRVSANSIVSFLGPSGAGKTTLLRIIAGLEQRFEGAVHLDGAPVRKPSRAIQVVFQDNRLLPWKNVAENVEFALKRNSRRTRSSVILGWLDKVGLADRRNVWPKTLSGGEEGRVAFARAFVDVPRVLLLDEPFRHVDLRVRHELRNALLRALSEEPMTVVLVSHSVEDAVFLSDMIYLVDMRPMSCVAEYLVAVPRPRQANDPGLIQLTADISRRMLSLGSGHEQRYG